MRSLALDIETVPADFWEPVKEDDFPPICAWRIVSIGLAWLTPELVKVEIPGLSDEFGFTSFDEMEAVRFTIWAIGQVDEVITFNGRGFDLPVLQARCMSLGLSWPLLHAPRGVGHRFGDRHVDLHDRLGLYGGARRHKLDEWMKALCPQLQKGGVSGAEVADLIASGEADRVHDYVSEDAVRTAILYWHWLHLCGRIDAKRLCELKSSAVAWHNEEETT